MNFQDSFLYSLSEDTQSQRYDSGVEEHIKDEGLWEVYFTFEHRKDTRLRQLSAGKAQADQRLPNAANAAAVGTNTHAIDSFKEVFYPPLMCESRHSECKFCH